MRRKLLCTLSRVGERPRGTAGRACALALALLAWCSPAGLLALTSDEIAFAEYLIKLRYFDTVTRYLDSMDKSKAADQRSLADIAWLRVDVLKAQGKEKEAVQAMEEVKKRFPNSSRASTGSLEVVGVALTNATKLLDQSIVQPKEKAAESVAKAEKLFTEEVAGPLDAMIAECVAKYSDVKSKNKMTDDVVQEALRVLQQVELARVNIYLMYAQKLPRDLPRRAELLGKGAGFAAKFVDERYDFPVMQYRAQLQLGIYTYELGQFAQAGDYLKLLYDAIPPLQRPFAKPVVDAFKSYRLQAILYGSRATISLGAYKRAVDLIEKYYLKGKKDDFDLSRAEDDPDLRSVATLVKLEYGAALCGVGLTSRGLSEIHAIIDKPGQPPALVTDGRKALGRVAALGSVRLSGKDYYEAALGLKSELKWDAALYTFQTALMRLDPRNEAEHNEYGPLVLNEIGEIYYLKGQFVESALAYEEACRLFGTTPHEILGKVSTNMLAAVTKAIQSRDDGTSHAGLGKLREAAVKYSDSFGGDTAVLQNYQLEGNELISQGQFDAAIEKYKLIPAVHKGRKVEFYWQAQAAMRECVCRKWDQASNEEKPKLEPELLKALDELRDIVSKALADGDKVGAGRASFFRGQGLYQRGQWDEAVKTLTVFTSDLADQKVNKYRIPGIAVLCLAEVRQGNPDAAAGHFKVLQTETPELPMVASVAAQIADAYEKAGNAARCAEFELIYMTHASSASEMTQSANLGASIKRLIAGGKTAEAKESLVKLRATGKEGDPALDRQVMYLEAKLLVQENKVPEGIAKFQLYINKFNPNGAFYEDPYVWYDLAQANLARRTPGKSGVSNEDMQQASMAWNTACGMMLERSRRDANDKDRELDEQTFWDWARGFWKLNMTLAAGGALNNYRALQAFVAEFKDSEFGGYKAEFMELDALAAAKLAGKAAPKTTGKATKTTGKDATKGAGSSKASEKATEKAKTTSKAKTSGKDAEKSKDKK